MPLDALRSDDVLRERLGRPIVKSFLRMKDVETERFRLHVTVWEIREYANNLRGPGAKID